MSYNFATETDFEWAEAVEEFGSGRPGFCRRRLSDFVGTGSFASGPDFGSRNFVRFETSVHFEPYVHFRRVKISSGPVGLRIKCVWPVLHVPLFPPT